MADKRMFSKQIIESDAFLDMPLSAQALYVHLSMEADDEGFVNAPKRIQRIVGASPDDLKLLIIKRFIIAFESGVIVIKHWRMNNNIRNDRISPTVYQDELKTLTVKSNKSYSENTNFFDTACQPNVRKMTTNCPQDDNQLPDKCPPSYSYSYSYSNSYSYSLVPTLTELKTYISEKKLNVEAEKFFDYYSKYNWQYKGQPINWQEQLQKWSESECKREPDQKTTYDINELEDLNVFNQRWE